MTSALNQPQPSPPSSSDQDRLEILVQYTALLNPQGVRQLIYRHGYNPQYQRDLPAFLLHFLQTGGESAVDEMLAIHPDRDLLLDALPASSSSALPIAASAGLSTFDGAASVSSALALQLAQLLTTRKAAVVDVLNRHGAAVLYDDATRTLSREAVRALQTDNPVLVRELAALTTAPALFTASYDQARTAGQLTASASLLGEVNVSLGADSLAVSRAKLQLAIAVAALLAVLLGVFVFLHVRNQGVSR